MRKCWAASNIPEKKTVQKSRKLKKGKRKVRVWNEFQKGKREAHILQRISIKTRIISIDPNRADF